MPAPKPPAPGPAPLQTALAAPATAPATPPRPRPRPPGPGQAAAGQPAAPRPPATLEFRSIDGSGNNLSDLSQNSTGDSFGRIGPANFSDSQRSLVTNLPNARTVSNLVVAATTEEAETPNDRGLSGMMYAWGQFIDHDINLIKSDGINKISIQIPNGDPSISGSISLTRTKVDPLTGLAINNVTGWIDGSMVYGSDAVTAASLRNAEGYMLTSAGNNLPIANGAFLAGDIRAQENPDLTALQTLFVREHNRQVDLLKAAHPEWSGDQLYSQARAIVGAEIAHITYSEFLPSLLGRGAIGRYEGYDPTVNTSMNEEFAGAAFRFGHSIVSANLQRLAENGSAVGPDLSLKDAFFQTTSDFAANGGAAGFLRKLASDVSNELDVFIVDDLRNFLNVPGASMDLAAINIQRGRDLGLGSLNQTRVALGLKAYTSFAEITSDASIAASLQAAYGSVDKLDLWIGGLAENHGQGAMVGETFQIIIANQFEALRDGDRLWYENQGFDRRTLDQINDTKLSDLILLNTDVKHIQDDVFRYVDRHGSDSVVDPSVRQLLIGKDGSDILVGGNENDILVAGLGNQQLTGGGGRDQFVLSQGGIQARVTDFTPGQDRLVFEQALTRDQLTQGLSISGQGANLLVSFQGANVTLVGVGANQLRPDDILAKL
jgi:hypothetical protein